MNKEVEKEVIGEWFYCYHINRWYRIIDTRIDGKLIRREVEQADSEPTPKPEDANKNHTGVAIGCHRT